MFYENPLLKHLTKMKALIQLFVLSSCFCINTSAQNTNIKIDSFTNINFIDSFLVYTVTCNDLWHDIDSCNQQPSQYLLWKKNGLYTIKKFESCKDYKHIHIPNNNPLSFYFSNKETIDKENIRPPIYYEYKKEKRQKYKIEVTSTISHSCFYNLSFRTNANIIKKKVDSYDLKFIRFNDGKESINSYYNNNTKLKELILTMETLINLTSFSNSE